MIIVAEKIIEVLGGTQENQLIAVEKEQEIQLNNKILYSNTSSSSSSSNSIVNSISNNTTTVISNINDYNSSYQSNDDSEVDQCYQCILCPPMFFQRKKNHQKRLWGLRVNTTSIASSSLEEQSFQQQQHQLTDQQNGRRYIDQESSSSFMNCCGSTSSTTTQTTTTNQIDFAQQIYPMFCALMKKLKEPQMQTLCQAVEKDAFDGQLTHCVLVPRGTIDGEEPHVIACRIWRWPDLQSAKELKRIPSCPNEMDPVYACCNPSHWNRLSQPGKYVFFLFFAFYLIHFCVDFYLIIYTRP